MSVIDVYYHSRVHHRRRSIVMLWWNKKQSKHTDKRRCVENVKKLEGDPYLSCLLFFNTIRRDMQSFFQFL